MYRLSPDRFVAPLVCSVLLTLVVAGCISEEAPNPAFVATGSDGVLFRGWDYEGATREVIGGRLDVDVNEATNNGTVRAGGRIGNQTITVQLTEFRHDADDFHSGGVAANFDEHGDSGVGNALLPKMHLLLATWGPGKVLVGGNATIDPYTGSDLWDAHLMVTSTGVREDGQVLKADGSGPYDPADPGNARIGSDHEAHLVLTSTYANGSLEPINQTFEESIQTPTGTVEMPFDVPIAAGDIHIEIDLGEDPQPGRYSFRLWDPDGSDRGSVVFSSLLPTSPTTGTIDAKADKAGTWTLVATSQTSPVSFTADLLVTFPPKPMYYFFWEDVDIDQRVVP